MEFDLVRFTDILRQKMYVRFPYDSTSDKQHIRDFAFMNNNIVRVGTDTLSFDIGNTYAESKLPYYHILEDAEVIHKPYKGTKISKGSQASISDLGKRDYGAITVKKQKNRYGKEVVGVFQEYRKNVRGSRSKVSSAQRTIRLNLGGSPTELTINRNSPYYFNKHYHYIEKMLDGGVLDEMASEFNLKRKRTELSALEKDIDI